MGVHRKRHFKEQGILDAAEEVFSKQGFENARMEEIAEIVGISKGSVYFYFESKENLYLALMYRAMEEMLDYFYERYDQVKSKKGYQVIYELCEAYLDFSEKNMFYFNLLQTYTSIVRQNGENLSSTYRDSLYFRKLNNIHNVPFKFFTEEIQKGQEDGSIQNKNDPALIYLGVWSILSGYASLRHHTISDSRETFYRVSPSDWRKKTLEIVNHLLVS